MKSVLISTQPKWCEIIANGEKTIEVRKTKPKIKKPFKCYIYCTKGNIDKVPKRIWWKKDGTGFEHIMNGKVIGEFVCDCITMLKSDSKLQSLYNGTQNTCLTDEELIKYAGFDKPVYYWHISDLKIYDKPKELGEFNLKRPPQSWCYVEELED